MLRIASAIMLAGLCLGSIQAFAGRKLKSSGYDYGSHTSDSDATAVAKAYGPGSSGNVYADTGASNSGYGSAGTNYFGSQGGRSASEAEAQTSSSGLFGQNKATSSSSTDGFDGYAFGRTENTAQTSYNYGSSTADSYASSTQATYTQDNTGAYTSDGYSRGSSTTASVGDAYSRGSSTSHVNQWGSTGSGSSYASGGTATIIQYSQQGSGSTEGSSMVTGSVVNGYIGGETAGTSANGVTDNNANSYGEGQNVISASYAASNSNGK